VNNEYYTELAKNIREYINIIIAEHGKNDYLVQIFDAYIKYHDEYFKEKFDNKFPKLDQKVDKLCTAIIHEATELQRLTSWKWWKQPVQFNTEKAKEELIDIFHFVLAIAIFLGMTPEDFIYMFMKKLNVNVDRQRNGY